jgi:hypothetical protein
MVQQLIVGGVMEVSNVISISEYIGNSTVSVLEKLLEKAKSGQIGGLIFTAWLGSEDHGIGVTGAYRDQLARDIEQLSEFLIALKKRDFNERRK